MMNKIILCLIVFTFLGCKSNHKTRRVWVEPPSGLGDKAEETKVTYAVQTDKSVEQVSLPLGEVSQIDFADNQKILNDEVKMGMAATSHEHRYLKYIKKAQVKYENKEYIEALLIVNKAIGEFPERSRFYSMQGTLYRKVGETRSALKSYQTALKIEPNVFYEEVIADLENELEENAL